LLSVGRAELMAAVVPSYKGFRYPVEVISHYVWLYHRFPLSLRGARRRGLPGDHPAVVPEFGQTYANGLRRRWPRPKDKRHLDEVFIKIHGKTRYFSHRSTARP
jgi:putative transposase